METPSDGRLLAMCLLAAVVAFAASTATGGAFGTVPLLIVSIVVLAALMFADGYVRAD